MIPRQFQLFGMKFKVFRKSELSLKRRAGAACYGLFIPDRQELWVCKESEKTSAAICEQTFWHEFTHAMLWVCHRPELGEDEALVDQLGYLLHQMATTIH